MQFHDKMISIHLLFSLLSLKQNKPAPCSYFSGPLVSGAQNCRFTSPDINSIIIEASVQLNICSSPAVIIV